MLHLIFLEVNYIKVIRRYKQIFLFFLRNSNKVLIVGAGQETMIPHTEGESDCRPLFSGVRYCTTTLRADTGDKTAVPYFPLNGETK